MLIKQEETVEDLFGIKYPQKVTQNTRVKVWTRQYVKKFIFFIQNNYENLLSQEVKRRTTIFSKASKTLGFQFTAQMCRKKFNRWLKSYGSVSNIIQMVNRDLYLSERNQKWYIKLGQRQKIRQLKLQALENEGIFYIFNGQVNLINQ